MITPRIIPSLLLSHGRLVKGVRFADYRDAGRPETTARAHNAQGADEILLLDIDASKGEGPDLATICQVAVECFMPLTVGGGIRSLDVAHRVMELGADKLCLTTAALANPSLIEQLAHLYGAQAVMLGVDICASGGGWRLFDHRTGKALAAPDPFAWIDEALARGAGEIRLMAVDREGSREGFDLDLFARVRARVNVPVILEGGAGSFDHIAEALRAGASGVGLGTSLIFSDANIVKIKRYLANNGLDLRL